MSRPAIPAPSHTFRVTYHDHRQHPEIWHLAFGHHTTEDDARASIERRKTFDQTQQRTRDYEVLAEHTTFRLVPAP